MVTPTQSPRFVENLNVSKQSCPVNPQDLDTTRDEEIIGEFDWSPATQGYVISASFLGYVFTQIPGGMLAEAFGAKYIIAFGLFISSVCHFTSPFVSRIHSNLMIFIQLLRGMGQGFLPVAHCVVAANWFPRSERGLLNTIAMSGYAVGALVGGIATGAICSAEALGGWPSSYYIFEILRLPTLLECVKKRQPTPWDQILCSVPVHALVISLFPHFWIASYTMSVHPVFLGTILHFRIEENGVFSSVPFVIQGASALFSSWTSNWLQKKNYVGVNRLRKGFSFLSYIGYFFTCMGMYAAGCNKWLSVGFNMLQAVPMGLAVGGSMIVAMDMTPRYGGSLMGLTNTIGSIGGFILPMVVGELTNNNQTLEQWNKVFCISGAISLGAGVLFCVFGSGDIQPWNFETIEKYEDYKANFENKKKDNLKNDNDIICHL
ncbi:hypothetical protein JTE90_023394 [Oedothorax gibbosus]|uniref:Major facilitator superfamily (MFS) profile domain-containing protein n=1 Tax=Oedothorax gibbosus TaxID=931172 RepID=A0AAV6UGJ4_9ARAC|nr:hypothetical protein JTE90_023394 [Oedothorax gibbosus]